jgi:hypothetical protein
MREWGLVVKEGILGFDTPFWLHTINCCGFVTESTSPRNAVEVFAHVVAETGSPSSPPV